jgi:hypothetical protein
MMNPKFTLVLVKSRSLWLMVLGMLLIFPQWLWAGNQEFKILNFDKKSLPKDLTYKGRIVDGAKWIDSNGENLLLLTEGEPIPSKKYEDARGAELYGYHFIKTEGKYVLLWQVYDFVRECVQDLTVRFFPGSLTITDLDKNGVAESTFLYKLACRSDVSPADMKLIMHEGKNKFAIRGIMKFPKGWIPDNMNKGKMVLDPAYEKAPAAFKQYGVKRWQEFNLETEFE